MSTKVTFTADDHEYDVFPEDAQPATPAETRDAYLRRTGGQYAKLRWSFVQVHRTATTNSQPSTLKEFARNHRAAVLYLALLTNWPWLNREDDPLPADAWIRFLTCDAQKGAAPLTWTPQSLSHAWGTLQDLNLIERPRKGRLIAVRPMREDGAGVTYKAPQGTGDPYFTLPHEFWTEQLHGTLSWPALAVLLILLKETNNTKVAELPIARAQRFYGIGRTSAEKGLLELQSRGLLLSRERMVKDADAPKGRRRASLHTLVGAFSTTNRERLRAAAKDRVAGSTSTAVEEKEADHKTT